jgi:branched-chain amino acid transport system permease protein
MNKTFAIAIVATGGLYWATLPWLGLPPFYESLLYMMCHWADFGPVVEHPVGLFRVFFVRPWHLLWCGHVYTIRRAWPAKLNWPFLSTLPRGGTVCSALHLGLGHWALWCSGSNRCGVSCSRLLTLAVTFVVATVILAIRPLMAGRVSTSIRSKCPNSGRTPSSSLYLMMLVAAL